MRVSLSLVRLPPWRVCFCRFQSKLERDLRVLALLFFLLLYHDVLLKAFSKWFTVLFPRQIMPHANSFSLNERLTGFLLLTSRDVIVSLVTSYIFIFLFFFLLKAGDCDCALCCEYRFERSAENGAEHRGKVRRLCAAEFFHGNESFSSVSLRHCCRAMGHCRRSAVCLVVSMLPTSDCASILNKHKLSCGLSNMAICSSRTSGGMIPAVGRTNCTFVMYSFFPRMADSEGLCFAQWLLL